MLTSTKDWYPKTPAQKLDHLRGVEAELITVQKMIPELVETIATPLNERAWNALTDEQQFSHVLDRELQRDNCRDYLQSLGRAVAMALPHSCSQRAHLQHAAAV